MSLDFNQTAIRKNNLTIESLFRNIIEKDDYPSFCALFKKYYTPLCYYSIKTVGDKQIAEEVVSDVFMKLWKNRSRIQVNSSYDSYLYRSVKNHSIDYLRSSLHEKIIKEPITDFHRDNFYESESMTSPGEFDETLSRVEQAIAQLPKRCQLVFKLNRLEGLKYREVSEKLNISMKAVEAQMTRALKILRAELADYQAA
ncbi:MAG: RNA polymerase sigma-70 factor [Spirosomaceae bacterium]|jgi:RNA polymerase sigma-70 factor (ECF subfamily)|nr:RNA polymerase sigma-70 factor [Spirosomataceae bacterium]